MMVHGTQNHWGSRVCPSCGIKELEHCAPETGSVSVLRWREEDAYSVGSLSSSLYLLCHNLLLFWRMVSSGLLPRVALVRTDVSEEPGASSIRVTKIGALGTTKAATSNRRMLRRNTKSPWWRRRQVPPKRRFLQEPHGVTTQKTPFFIVTTVKTSNLTLLLFCFPLHLMDSACWPGAYIAFVIWQDLSGDWG
jgi:hypothetical protein